METSRIELVKLSAEHLDPIASELGLNEEVFRWLPWGQPQSTDQIIGVLRKFIAEREIGTREPFAVLDKASQRLIGTTSLMDINPANRALEIGSTFYVQEFWRSYVNSHCKLLLLTEAFENRDTERVTLKTDARNQRSRNAITRIGATFEGVLRHHMLLPDGTWRDSAYFSILREEWPAVKEELTKKINSYES